METNRAALVVRAARELMRNVSPAVNRRVLDLCQVVGYGASHSELLLAQAALSL